ncbi:MAG TPA: hypothetical protein VH619_02625 [Verrucomicrobiae bacterium]|jgi:hypothetical protein|nr:hypothetical protein [Verrucomicrobiae bacterium]
MKTPREFFLGRHEAAAPRLDRVRNAVLVSMANSRRSIAWKLWEELILPARRAWIGIAAAWVVVIGLNLLAGDDGQSGIRAPGPINPESVIALQRQDQWMAQLTEPLPAKAPEDQPRSEAPVEQKII